MVYQCLTVSVWLHRIPGCFYDVKIAGLLVATKVIEESKYDDQVVRSQVKDPKSSCSVC